MKSHHTRPESHTGPVMKSNIIVKLKSQLLCKTTQRKKKKEKSFHYLSKLLNVNKAFVQRDNKET